MPDDGTEQRKLAAIMFTDMVGYSALVQRNEALALELLEEHHRLLRPVFPKFGGREIKSTGDGFLVEFASALAAAQCAIEIQKTLVQYNAAAGPERRFQVRIGVHLGDVVLREADIFGDGVNIAARIEPLAEAGGICLSRPVVDQVANKIDSPLVKLGTPELKNISVPMDVYRVVLPWHQPPTSGKTVAGLRPHTARRLQPTVAVAVGLVALLGVGVWLWQRSPGAKPERIDSLAVLIVPEVGAEAHPSSLAAELTEGLTTRMARLGSFNKVISPSAMARYRAPRVSPHDITRELGVNALVEGEIRADRDRVSFDLRLIGAGQRRSWWSATFANALGDVDRLVDEASLAILRELDPTATLTLESHPAPEAPARRQATQLYRQARYLNYFEGVTNSLAAIQLLEQAVAVDDTFAKAWAALAIKYVEHFYVFDPAKQETWGSKAFAAADTALTLDSKMAEVYVARAKLLWAPISGFQHEKALAELRQALELDWQSFAAHEFASVVCEHVGLLDEALVHARRAEELDPLSPYPLIDQAAPHLDAGNHAEALRYWQRVPSSAQYQSYVGSHWAWTLFALGDTAGAKAKVEEYFLLARNDPAGEDKAGGLTAMKALLAAAAGDIDNAKLLIAVAEKKEDRYGEFHHTGYLIAATYARLRQPAETLRWLKKTAVEGFPCYPLFAKDPNLDPVRADSQVQTFLTDQAGQYESRKTSWPKTTAAVDGTRGRR
ncbi:MAG: hypothetical protein HYY24_20505 [Verrucomicrobia bacterium]|nr:hypothetical protein [Verrucomicrobiota bacterium]